MKVDWIKGLDEESKDKTSQLVRRSSAVLDLLKEILVDYELNLDRSELDINTFNSPNWAYKQAYKNGYRSCLHKIRELITVEKENE